ncbi:MAG: DUF4369 domain-containing protein, partial [Lewinella sp.]|nr:DUF4369 domain-containing protein [Lewinella sp.]
MKAQININWIILLLCLSSCRTAVQPADGFTINATINGLEDGWAKLVKLDLNTNGQILVDSTIIQNGAFSFAGHLETPYLHSIIINDAPEKIHIFLENSP